MLLANHSLINQPLGRMHSGVTNQLMNFKVEVMSNRFFPECSVCYDSIKRDSFPTGTQSPYSFIFGFKGALISSTTKLKGISTISGGFSMGKTMVCNISGMGGTTAEMSITSRLIAEITCTSTITPNMAATLGLAASLAGIGDIESSLSMLIPLAAEMGGAGGILANLKGNLDISADIYVNESEATVRQLVEGVWGALASDYNSSGTMGEKLNAAGTAGDPWTADLSGYNTSGTAGKELKDKLSEDSFLALK